MTTLSREALLEILSQRYTAKHYDRSRKISDEDWAALLESVRLSPSSLNLQPWRLVVVSDEAQKERLLAGIKDFNQQRVRDASHLLIFTIPLDINDEDLDQLLSQETIDGRFKDGQTSPDKMRRAAIDAYRQNPGIPTWAAEQVYLAAGMITFAASALGIDSTILGAFITISSTNSLT